MLKLIFDPIVYDYMFDKDELWFAWAKGQAWLIDAGTVYNTEVIEPREPYNA